MIVILLKNGIFFKELNQDIPYKYYLKIIIDYNKTIDFSLIDNLKTDNIKFFSLQSGIDGELLFKFTGSDRFEIFFQV